LGDPQAQGRLGDRAELGHGYKCTGVPQVHARLYHSGIRKQSAYVLDACQRFAVSVG
jgi:hypothetical protein